MKKLFTVLFFLYNISSIYSQLKDWEIFKSPPLLHSSNPVQYNLSVSINRLTRENINYTGTKENKLRNDWFDNKLGITNTIPDNFIVCMAQDSSGNIWIGTFSGGIAKYDGKTWTVYNTSNSGLPSNTIYSLLVDEKNNLWIATTSGLAIFDGENWKVYNLSNSKIPSDVIYSLAADKNGHKWIGTGAGLAKFDGKRWTSFNLLNSRLPDDNVTAISIDNEGNKWIGTFEGLVRIDGVNWRIYNTSNSAIPFDDIYSITSKNDGEIIVGTWGGGLAILNKDKWKVIQNSNSGLPDNFISSIVIDDEKKLIIGTLGGLAKYDGKKWLIKNFSNSLLPDNMVYSLLKDKNENLWIGTKDGLAVYKEGGIKSRQASLEAFTCNVINKKVNLFWKSKFENNVIRFEIEKKTNNSIWEKIGIVKNGLFGNSENQFSFIDNYPQPGKNFYRLKNIDCYGTYNYSKTIETTIALPSSYFLEAHFNTEDISTIIIKYGSPEAINTKLSVYDSYEREVATFVDEVKQAGIYNYQFSFGQFGLIPGIYFIHLQTENIVKTKMVQLIE